MPSQPDWNTRESALKRDVEYWKDIFSEKHPEADVDKDGKLSWAEFKAYKAKLEDKSKQ